VGSYKYVHIVENAVTFVILSYARKHAPQADLKETERVPARVAGEGRGWEC